MKHIVKHLSAAAGGSAPVENFNSLVGLELVVWERDHARIDLVLRPEHQNGVGSVHGGVLMTLLDTVSGFAGVYSPDDEEQRRCATISFNVKFVKAATSGTLHAEAHCQGGGKSIFFTRAEIRDDAGHLIATGDGTFRLRLVKPHHPAAE
jgi:uncharacterized protein (TIGR00369 family)